MSIESRFPTEEINIKDLSLEMPERPGIEFQVDVAGVQKMIDFCNASKGDQLANIFKSEALELERLGLRDRIDIPDKYKECQRSFLLGEGRNPKRYQEEKFMWEHYIKLLSEFKRLFPESVTPELNNFKWEEVRDEIQKLTWVHKQKLDQAAELKTVKPKEIGPEIISQKAREKYFDDMRSAKKSKKWDEYGSSYRNLRILKVPIPEDLIIDQETYDLISEELKKRMKPGFNNQTGTFGSLAADLRVICANDVSVDDSGVYISDRSISDKTARLPEVKKF